MEKIQIYEDIKIEQKFKKEKEKIINQQNNLLFLVVELKRQSREKIIILKKQIDYLNTLANKINEISNDCNMQSNDIINLDLNTEDEFKDTKFYKYDEMVKNNF